MLWVALLGIVILFIYSIVSFIFYHEYFYTGDTQLFCKNLGECFVSVLRYGLLDGIGLVRHHTTLFFTRNHNNHRIIPSLILMSFLSFYRCIEFCILPFLHRKYVIIMLCNVYRYSIHGVLLICNKKSKLHCKIHVDTITTYSLSHTGAVMYTISM